jgi:hypothetical protein
VQSSKLFRWGGLAALVSAAVSIMGDILRLFVDVESAESAIGTSYALVFWLYLIGAVLLLLGLVGLYVSQSEAAGVLGLVGFLVAFAGTALLSGALWFELFITPALAVESPELAEAELGLAGFILSFLLVIVGWLLFGAATLRAHVYPRWAAVLLIVGAIVSFAPVPLAGTVLSVAVAWLGFLLFTGKVISTEESARVN